jgi:hypothetical protein
MRTLITKTTKSGKKQKGANVPFINASESPTCEKDADDGIEKLVEKQLGNIQEAEKAFTSALALLEKQQTKHPALEQYIQQVSASNRSIQILEDIKDQTRSHYIFKISFAGVELVYQIAHPGETAYTKVDRAAWISHFQMSLAKAIAQITLTPQATRATSWITVRGELLPP